MTLELIISACHQVAAQLSSNGTSCMHALWVGPWISLLNLCLSSHYPDVWNVYKQLTANYDIEEKWRD